MAQMAKPLMHLSSPKRMFMFMKHFSSPLSLVLAFITLLLIQLISVTESLIVENLDRKVDLTNRIVKVTLQTTLYNPSETEAVDSFYVALPKDVDDRTGLMRINYNGNYVNVKVVDDLNTLPFEVRQALPNDEKRRGKQRFVICQAPISIGRQSRIKYELEYLLGKSHEPLPKQSAYGGRHLVVYEDYSTAVSPYVVKHQTATFTIPKHSIMETSRNLQVKNGDSCVTEETLDQPAFELGAKNVRIHYALNTHLGYFPSVSRQLEVSHWGSISVKEQYQFVNLAAELNVEYDRWVVAKSFGAMLGRIRSPGAPYPKHKTCFQLDSILPRLAYDVQFFDETGNISSSFAHRTAGHTLLQVEPRFPVLGGWKSDWRVEYKIPTESAVAKIPSKHAFKLTIPLGTGMKSIYTESLKAKIIFPNGANNLQVTVPRELRHSVAVGHYWGWLDFLSSRPYVELEVDRFAIPDSDLLKHNLQIEYEYRPGVSDITKPLGLVAIALCAFLLFIIFSRIDFRIFSKTMESYCFDDDILEEVAIIARQIIDLHAARVHALESAASNHAIASVIVGCKAEEMQLTLRLSQISAIARDSYSLAPVTKHIVLSVSAAVNQYVLALDEVANGAEVGGRSKPRPEDDQADMAKKELQRLVKVVTSTIGAPDALLLTSTKKMKAN